MKENHIRSVVKAITWRMIATSTTVSLVFLFTGEWVLSLGIGVLEVFSKLLFFYLHERGWQHVSWGKMSK